MKMLLVAIIVNVLAIGCGVEDTAIETAKQEIEAKEREAAGLPNTPVATTPPKVEEEAKPVPMSAERIYKLYELADALHDEGEYLEAKERMTKAYASFGLLEEKDPEDHWDYLYLLILLAQGLGEADDMIKYATKLGKVDEDEETAAYVSTYLGRAYRRKGEYDKAIRYAKEALAYDIKEYGEEDKAVATGYSDIGRIYDDKEDYDKALEYYEKSLAIKLKVLDPDDASVGSSYHYIGLIYDNKGDYDKALEYYEKSLSIGLKHDGPEHPETATTYLNLGVTYSQKGDKAKALAYLRKAKAIYVKQLGADYPDVKNVQSWIDTLE
jgi:tetratricopeptide (TPR) repeat protein